MKINPRLFLLSCVAASAMMSGTAMAQDADTDTEDARKLDTVTVIATRTGETDLQTTAVAVSAFDTEMLEQRNVADLQDVAKFAPGLTILGQPGRGGGVGGSVAIRGMGTDAQEAQASTGIYIDDVYFPSGAGNVLGLLDVERVEVLRGPQGTLFGRNTIAGAIQYVSTKPGDEFEGYAQGTYGSYNRTDIEGAVTLPIADKISVRIAGMRNETDGYVDNLSTGETQGDSLTEAFRIRAVIEPTDRLTFDLKAETIALEQDGRNNIIGEVNPFSQFPFLAAFPICFADAAACAMGPVPGAFGPFQPVDTSTFNAATLVLPFDDPDDYAITGLNAPDFFDFEYTVFQGTASFDLTDNLTFKSISAYVDSSSTVRQDFDLTPLPILETVTDGEITAFSQEFQLSGSAMDDRLHFVTGVYYYDSEDLGSASSLVGIGNFPAGGTRANIETESIALFGQGTYNLSDSLSVAFGLRYTDETITSSIDGVAGTDLEFGFDDLSPHIGINYEVNDDVFLYAKASKGFRAGGNTADLTLPNNGLSYDPEEAWTYEAGARLTINDVFRVNPTLFFTDWTGVQSNIIVFTPAPVATNQNVGDAEIKGLELDGEWLLTDNFSVNFSAAFTDAEYTRLADILTSQSGGGILPGSSLAGLPETRYTIGGLYTHSFANGMQLDLSGNYSYLDDQRSTVQSGAAFNIPSYGLLGARAQLQVTNNFTVSLFGDNLTDEVYFIGATDFAQGATVGIQELNVGRGRAYGVEGRVSF